MIPCQEGFRNLNSRRKKLVLVNNQLQELHEKYVQATMEDKRNRTAWEIQADFVRVWNLRLQSSVLKCQIEDGRDELLDSKNLTG